VVAIIPFALTLLFQNPVVQTISARLAANMLTKSLGQSVTINTISIGFFSGININELNVQDHHNNTLIYIDNLNAMPVFSNLGFNKIDFLSIELDSVHFNMGTYKSDANNNLSHLVKKITGGKEKNGDGGFKLFLKSLKLKNSSFNLFNQNSTYAHGSKSMDYANMGINNINSDISEFKLIGDSLNFKISSLSANEKCGLLIKDLKADFIISSIGLILENTVMNLNNSEINADFGMQYSGYSSFSDYVDSVNMTVDVRPTIINMADIGYFSAILFEMPNVVGITGKMNGTVRDMVGEDLKIKFGTNTRLSGDIRFTGLPDFYTTNMIGKELYLTSNPHDISKFYLPIEEKHLDFSNIIPHNEQITASGNFNGYYKDFNSSLDVVLSYGKIKSNVKFKQTTNEGINFNITAVGDSVNVGEFLSQPTLLGRMSFNIDVSGEGETQESISYNTIAKFMEVDLLGYNYKRIGIEGSYINKSIIASLRVGDPNLMMAASITADIVENPVFTLKSNIVSANLNRLNLWYNQAINFSSTVDAKVEGTNLGTLSANISLTENKLVFSDDEYSIDSIIITKNTDSLNITSLSLNSDIAESNISGNFNISTITESIFGLVDNYYNVIPGVDSTRTSADKYVDINVNIIKPRIFSKQILSGIKFSPNTMLYSKFDFVNNDLQLNFSSKKIQYHNIKLDSSDLKINNLNDSLFLQFAISNIILKDSTSVDTLVFGLDDFSLSSKISNDSIIYGINWDNRIQTLKNSGVVEGYLAQTPDSTSFSIGKANVFVNDIMWKIDSNNLVVFKNNRVFFHDIYIKAGQSEFNLLGTIPKNDKDSLVAEFTDWDLSTFDIITNPLNIDLDGKVNGSLSLTMIKENPTFVSDISIKDLALNKEYLGDAHILNTWDNTNNSVFIKSQIIRQGNVGKGEVFLADGYYYPFIKEDNLSIDISFNRFKLKTVEPFVHAFVQELEGTTSGNLKIRGSVLKPMLMGSIDMQRAAMRIVYLNTKYSFSNSIDFVKNSIDFDKLVIYDTLGNQADINGSLTHDYFKDPKFDVSITTPGLLFFNTTEHMNSLYYGSAIASGDISIKGSPNDIDLNINISTKKGTSVILPLDYSVEISDKDYIIFVKPTVDSLTKADIIEESEINKKKQLSYNISVGMHVTPDAKVGINLPDDMGTIEARGTSNLDLDVNSNGRFSLVGDYVVNDGLFHFKIGNLVSKRFSLVKGGRISWSGNPYSANVSIKGLYKVKTSLSSLGVSIDTTASYKNKVTVECYVVLTGELLNPNIKFEINIPDIDPDQQRIIYSELDTTNVAEMNQQMISLLVLGTFSFNNAANVSVQSSYYNVIANQLSSMLSRISDNVDVGLNYKPGDDLSQEEFEVALSTQLFDDRLTIDGNFGMTYDRSQQNASNIVGDVDIGYKLTPEGQWVLKVFNHSNVNSWYNYNTYDQVSPYTQGVGIAFKKDFNNIKELFERRNKDKKKSNKSKVNKELIKTEDDDN